MDDVAIVGVGQSNFSRACGISIKELAFEAFKANVGAHPYHFPFIAATGVRFAVQEI